MVLQEQQRLSKWPNEYFVVCECARSSFQRKYRSIHLQKTNAVQVYFLRYAAT